MQATRYMEIWILLVVIIFIYCFFTLEDDSENEESPLLEPCTLLFLHLMESNKLIIVLRHLVIL